MHNILQTRDNCKFSHDALNDVTKDLLDKIINTEEENAREDELELEDLRKQGIAPLPKPPPGVGLLPTPDLAQKIGLSGSNFSQNQGEGSDQFSGGSEDAQTAGMVPSGPSAPPIPPPESTVAMGHPTGPPMPQSPPGLHPPHGFPMPPPIPPGQPPPFYVNRPNMNPPMNMQRPPPFPPDLQMLQNLFPFPPMGQNPVDFFRNFLGNQAPQGVDPGLAFMQNLQQNMGADSTEGHPLHLTQQQQESLPPGNEPQRAEGPDDNNATEMKLQTGTQAMKRMGAGVSSILKCLKKQNEEAAVSVEAPPGCPVGDPRLVKERAPPSDPRVKTDPRQRPPDTKKESDGAVDPRFSRDPRKIRPMEPSSFRQQGHPGSKKPPAGMRMMKESGSPGTKLSSSL
ncbi:hypothetical protein KUCAC02_024491 [Chaenocephalus aceratus]|uniref:Uncharacterized protein n=1 Tax=Chaenocephalus aceratus TaxID=36190 RepID=A0ACB9WIC3_CHAAC|nr:hypothetical protein KUCAC02_024491 [Chaenocephalus aceratus]